MLKSVSICVAVVMLTVQVVSACPACAANNAQGEATWTVWVMIAAPFVVIGGVGVLLHRIFREDPT